MTLTAGKEYRLVVRKGGISTIHNDPATEQCNLDDTQADIKVGDATAAELLTKSEAALCGHCFPND